MAVAGCAIKPHPEPGGPAAPEPPAVPASKPVPEQPPAGSQGVSFRQVSATEALALARRMDPRAQGFESWRDLRQGVLRSLGWALSKPLDEQACPGSGLDMTWRDVARSQERLLGLLPQLDKEPEALAERFRWLEMAPGPLMTGYYLPLVPASLEPRPDYPYPLYGAPDDLRRLDLGLFRPDLKGERIVFRVVDGEPRPYYTREEIDFQGALAGRGLEIAWVRDLFDAYHLQVQGSGTLLLPDGARQRIGFAANNGLAFQGVGSVIQANGWMQGVAATADNVRTFLRDNPDKARQAMAANPRYVFFRFLEGEVVGAMGRPLTPMASVAVDPKVLPLGALLFLEADLPPRGSDTPGGALAGPALAQDCGGAIEQNHIDFFWGEGDEAGYRAKRTKVPARLFLLLAPQARGSKAREEGP